VRVAPLSTVPTADIFDQDRLPFHLNDFDSFWNTATTVWILRRFNIALRALEHGTGHVDNGFTRRTLVRMHQSAIALNHVLFPRLQTAMKTSFLKTSISGYIYSKLGPKPHAPVVARQGPESRSVDWNLEQSIKLC
jgi:hypothetical protein